MLSKQDLKFDKPNYLGEDTYKYEWVITYVTIFNQLLLNFGFECTCKKMIVTENWEFRCMVQVNKNGFDCFAVDYCKHNLEMFQTILTNPSFYPNRSDITGKGPSSFPKMLKNMYRIIAHTNYHHKDLFNKYEEKYRLNERFLLFCRKYNLINKKDIYIK
jgi:hypothetical protein